MTFEKSEGKEYDDVKRNEFIRYVEKAFFHIWIKQMEKRASQITEMTLAPEDFDWLLDQRALELDRTTAEAARLSPVSWDDVMDSIENPKLDRILSQLTPDEQELLFIDFFQGACFIGSRIRKSAFVSANAQKRWRPAMARFSASCAAGGRSSRDEIHKLGAPGKNE